MAPNGSKSAHQFGQCRHQQRSHVGELSSLWMEHSLRHCCSGDTLDFTVSICLFLWVMKCAYPGPESHLGKLSEFSRCQTEGMGHSSLLSPWFMICTTKTGVFPHIVQILPAAALNYFTCCNLQLHNVSSVIKTTFILKMVKLSWGKLWTWQQSNNISLGLFISIFLPLFWHPKLHWRYFFSSLVCLLSNCS